MPKKPTPLTHKIVFASILCVALAAVAMVAVKLRPAPAPAPVAEKGVDRVRQPVAAQPVIDYANLEKDEALKNLMAERKSQYGLESGVDMIAKSDEAIKVGDTTVPMQDVVEKIRLKIGDIVEKDLSRSGRDTDAAVRDFGIYVVHPGDNIWNVHFKFLQDYFAQRGRSISPAADEPGPQGGSTGVGKLLKFSEKIVHIYNVREKELETDLNLIHPYSKVVVYNMEQVFNLLNQIDLEEVDRIQFDGENIWITAN